MNLIVKFFKNVIGDPIKTKNVYFGIDPSGPNLHLGHYSLLKHAIMMQKNYGHHIYIVLGNATVMVGDPSDKLKTRNLKDRDEYLKYTGAIARALEDSLSKAHVKYEILYNYDWLSNLNALHVFENHFSEYSVNRLVKTDFVANRLSSNQNLSLKELVYFTLQANDFLHLATNLKGGVLQIGGSDQHHNILMGLQLCKSNQQNEVSGATIELLTIKGKKLSKTDHGTCVELPMLDEAKAMHTYYAIYKMIAEFDEDTLSSWQNAFCIVGNPELDLIGQKVFLFNEIMALVYGDEITAANVQQLDAMDRSAPYVEVNDTNFKSILVTLELFSSNSEAVRALDAGAVKLYCEGELLSVKATDELNEGASYYVFYKSECRHFVVSYDM